MTMSDKTELTKLDTGDLAELTLGLHFVFWSLLVFVMSLTETLATPVLRAFPVLFLGAGGLGAICGVYRLQRITALGVAWRKRMRQLMCAAGLAAYLSLFYLLWRQASAELYLLAHALVFFGVVIVLLGLLCAPVMQLARLAGRPNLVLQCGVFGALAMGLLAPAYALVVRTLVTAIRHGYDPLLVLQFWLERTSWGAALLILLPVALMLSLVWSAKELAVESLRAKRLPVS